MLVYGHDAQIAEWVALKLDMRPFAEGLFTAIGIIENGRLIAGIVYNNHHTDKWGNPLLIEMTIASVDKAWCTRHNLEKLFLYPFRQLRVKRVQATCGRKAKRVRLFLKRLGFTFEGIIRQAHPSGGDAAHYSMLENECVWIKHGQKFPVTSRDTRPECSIGSANAIEQGYGTL